MADVSALEGVLRAVLVDHGIHVEDDGRSWKLYQAENLVADLAEAARTLIEGTARFNPHRNFNQLERIRCLEQALQDRGGTA